jgi:hypothetical protein
LSVFNVMSETMKARKWCLEYLLCAFRLGNQGHRVELYRTEKRNKKNNSHVWYKVVRSNNRKASKKTKQYNTCEAFIFSPALAMATVPVLECFRSIWISSLKNRAWSP